MTTSKSPRTARNTARVSRTGTPRGTTTVDTAEATVVMTTTAPTTTATTDAALFVERSSGHGRRQAVAVPVDDVVDAEIDEAVDHQSLATDHTDLRERHGSGVRALAD